MRISAAFGVAVMTVATVSAQSPESQFFTASDGVKIHYFELGRSGTPVLLIHGYNIGEVHRRPRPPTTVMT